MAGREFSFNLGLAASPETQDPTQFSEFIKLYNACFQLAFILDLYTGGKSFPQEDWPELVPAQSQKLQNLTRGYCKFTETVVAGQLLHFINTAGALESRLANATDATKPARAFALNDVTAGEYGEYMLLGAITNFAGLTPGTPYYLSTSAGLITATKPVTSGNLQQPVGFALDANTLWFNPVTEGAIAP